MEKPGCSVKFHNMHGTLTLQMFLHENKHMILAWIATYVIAHGFYKVRKLSVHTTTKHIAIFTFI